MNDKRGGSYSPAPFLFVVLLLGLAPVQDQVLQPDQDRRHNGSNDN